MKKIFTISFVLLFCIYGVNVHAQTTYASVSGGSWAATAPYIWETYATGIPVGVQGSGTAATGIPSGSHNVYIRGGHSVVTDANRNTYNMTIEPGGTIAGGSTSTERYIRLGTGASGASGIDATLTNNGTIGGGGDRIYLEVGLGAQTALLTGTGTTTMGRIRFLINNANPSSTLTIDKDVTLIAPNNYAFSATGSSLSFNDNYTLTINAGKTVTLTAGNWHNSVAGGVALDGGNYTYNINGTLDMSSSITTSGNSPFAGSPDATKATTVNINGTVKLPTSGTHTLNMSEALATGQQGGVFFNINNNGLLDGNIAPINTTTTTLPVRFFNISGNGLLKRTAGPTDVLFAVGTSSSYSPATINNAGTVDNFSVNVSNTITNAPPTASVVNKQWTIQEDVAGGSDVTLKLGWLTADQSAGFNPALPIFILRYTGTAYESFDATLSGSGTAADPYIATAAGISAFGQFIVSNDAIITPVTFISTRAFTKLNGVQVEWSTASEFDLHSFVVERSADGRNFTAIQTIASNTGSRNNTYSYFDASPNAGVNYYRIKANESFTSARYTQILRVSMNGKVAEMIIANNPVQNGVLNLQLNGMVKGMYNLALYNSYGQKVMTRSLQLEGGSLSQAISLPVLSKGVYVVQLRSNETKLAGKIIVE